MMPAWEALRPDLESWECSVYSRVEGIVFGIMMFESMIP